MGCLFEELADRVRHDVYTYARYSLGAAEDAEDVTQEVLIKLWQHRSEIDAVRARAWVMRVARNAVIDALRRRRTRRAAIAQGESAWAAATAAAAAPGGPEQALRQRDFEQTISSALARLDDPYRSILVMREIQDMSYRDIADALDLPLNTLKVYLHRARRRLRDTIRGRTPK